LGDKGSFSSNFKNYYAMPQCKKCSFSPELTLISDEKPLDMGLEKLPPSSSYVSHKARASGHPLIAGLITAYSVVRTVTNGVKKRTYKCPACGEYTVKYGV
jgi:hypothetical protein